MADNKFNIVISATDKATSVVNKVNKTISKLFRPYDQAKRSAKSFHNALGQNDLVKRSLSVFDKIGKGVTTFGTTFGVAENSVLSGSARMAGALGMIGGPIGGILAGATALVGGVGAVSVSMAGLGMNISRTAKGLNISTTDLQEYRGAAKLAGLQTQSMDNGLKSLGETLQRADLGMAPEAAFAMQMMGGIKKTPDGLIDTLDAVHKISDYVSRIKDQNLARAITDQFGITDLLPLLREGGDKIDEYRAKQRQLGIQTDEQIRRNVAQQQSWNETKTALDSAGVSMGNVVAKWLDLNTAAKATSELAEKLQKVSGFWSTLGTLAGETGKRIWNNGPWSYLPRKVFGEVGAGDAATAPAAAPGRFASGKVTESAGAGRGSINPPLALNAVNATSSQMVSGAERPSAAPQPGMSRGASAGRAPDQASVQVVTAAEQKWGLPSGLLDAVWSVESSRGKNMQSPKGAMGHFQFMPETAKQYGLKNPFDLSESAEAAGHMYHDLLSKYRGNIPTALAAYNWGGGNVDKKGLQNAPDETRDYIRQVLEQMPQAVANALRDAPIHMEVHGAPKGLTIKPVRGLGLSSAGTPMAAGGIS